jgi:membrane protease YdiL (CAAX protease family)
MLSDSLKRFIGIDRFRALLDSYTAESKKEVPIKVSYIGAIVALGISLLPAASYFLDIYKDTLDIVSVIIGIATLLAILFRVHHGIPFNSVTKWRSSLSLTHTAFALGAIPTVFVLIFNPESLLPPPEIMNAPSSNAISSESLTSVILQISVWAGLTEEFIYRGLLISALRRAHLFGLNQINKDKAAVLISAVIFGFSHYMLWGLTPSLTLTGLGIGFGLAYIAIGELILPLIVYHIIFDALSLSFAFLAYKM